MAVIDYSTTAGSNTDIEGVGIQGSNAVNNFDNALRQLMADIASSVTRYVTKSAAYTGLKSDHGQLIEFTATATLSLTTASTLTSGWMCIVKANGGTVTIDPASSEQIDGATTKTITDGSFAFVYCDGTAFHTIALPSLLMTLSSLTPTDGNIIVGNGSTWITESGATARTSLGAQTQGDVLDDLNTLGANAADGEFLVGTGAGALAWESGDTALASLGGGSFGIALFKDTTASEARTELELGTAATLNTGTSGATIPLLNAANTFSAVQTFGDAQFDGSTTGSLTISVDPGNDNASSRILFKIDNTNVMEIDASGNLTIAGDWTTQGTIS